MWRFKRDLPIDLPSRLSSPSQNPIAKQCKRWYDVFHDAERLNYFNATANALKCKPKRLFCCNQSPKKARSSDMSSDIVTLAMWRISSDLQRTTLEKLFATSLMSYVARCFSMNHIALENMCTFDDKVESPLTDIICKAVERLVQKLTPTAMLLHFHHLHFKGATVKDFEQYLRKMGLRMLIQGFKEYDFMEFCTLVCLIAVICRRNGMITAPNSATGIIDDVVQWFRSTGEWPEKAWEDLQREAVHFAVAS